LENIKDVLSVLQTAGLKLKPSKCFFAHSSVKYLGFVISNDGRMPSPERLEAISKYPRPKNVQDLRRFVVLASCYRRFVSGFSDIIYLLNTLLQKSTNFVWNSECESAFHTLKAELITAPVLAFPTINGQFVLYTNASDIDIGAVLAQRDANGDEKVISYASKGFSSSEKKLVGSFCSCLGSSVFQCICLRCKNCCLLRS